MLKHDRHRSLWLPTLVSLLLSAVCAGPVTAEVCYQDADGRIVERRRPGFKRIECPEAKTKSRDEARRGMETKVLAPSYTRQGRTRQGVATREGVRSPRKTSPIPRPGLADYVESVPLQDRWRIVDSLGYENNWWDPYHRNTLKGDVPIHADDWFFNLGLISDSLYEVRDVVTPVGSSSTGSAGEIDLFGSSDQWALVQNFAMEYVYYKGDTVFKPPEYEFRFLPVINYNRTVLDEVQGINVRPGREKSRTDYHIGVQGLFVDKHLRNVSDRYDFDSLRIGIQPFSSDFRGFLFQDNQLGIRFFGNRDDNIFQYNLAWFRRLEKDTNSGLNDLSQALRKDDIFLANLYWQDMPVRGFVSQATVVYNRNREGDDFSFDKNDFIQRPASLGRERPREYDVVYLGLNGDGHFGRLNLTASVYLALGQQDQGVFTDRSEDIEAVFAAAEASMDFNWIRARLSLLYGSGDDDPFDDKATGFDAIFENPQFAGADSSYWIRQAVPLAGGGRVALSSRNGVLNSLRSSKEEGQSNFANPGIWLAGLGVDLDVLPELRASFNWNYLRFDKTDVLEVARNQGGIDEEIGQDLSFSLIYRPFMSQNIVVRGSYARLFAGQGFDDLYPDDDPDYFLLNIVLTY